jgi:ribosomal protein L37AE/L43A
MEKYDEGYDYGYEEGVAHTKEDFAEEIKSIKDKGPTCPFCYSLLQKELFVETDVIKCSKCRREYKLVEVKE